jgi:hypothetical protein
MPSVTGQKGHWANLASRGIPQEQEAFGENLGANIFNAEIISRPGGGGNPICDLYNAEHLVGFQARMCNCKHSQVPKPRQIARLHDEIQVSFLIRHGVYALIYYGGVKQEKVDGKWKYSSLTKSRTLSILSRMTIWAKELQYIYIVDVRLLHYLVVHHPELVSKKALCPHPWVGGGSEALPLNRTFMKGFRDGSKEHARMLRRALKGKPGMVKEFEVTLDCLGEEDFQKKLPIYIVGRTDTVEATSQLVQSRSASTFDIRGTAALFSGKESTTID